MNILIAALFSSMVAFSAAGNAGTSAVVVGPSGVVTNQGAIGPHGSEVGLGHYGAGLGYNGYNGYSGYNGYNNIGGVNGAGLGLGLHGAAGLTNGLYGAAGLTNGIYGAAGLTNGLYGAGYGNGLYGSGLGLSSGYGLGLHGGAGLGLGYGQGLSGLANLGYGNGGYGHGGYGAGLAGAGLNTVTPGGGRIGVSHAGAIVQGPPTAPAVIAGPSGKISANGLWGPTANIGLAAGHGNVAHGW